MVEGSQLFRGAVVRPANGRFHKHRTCRLKTKLYVQQEYPPDCVSKHCSSTVSMTFLQARERYYLHILCSCCTLGPCGEQHPEQSPVGTPV